MKDKQQNQYLLLKVDQRSNFHNFLQPATNVFVVQQVDHAKWKTPKVAPKFATKQRCVKRWGFLYFVFKNLKEQVKMWISQEWNQGLQITGRMP